MAKGPTVQECICGADIEWQELPPDVAVVSDQDGFWRHTNGDTRCYPDSPEDAAAVAEPSDGSWGKVRF